MLFGTGGAVSRLGENIRPEDRGDDAGGPNAAGVVLGALANPALDLNSGEVDHGLSPVIDRNVAAGCNSGQLDRSPRADATQRRTTSVRVTQRTPAALWRSISAATAAIKSFVSFR